MSPSASAWWSSAWASAVAHAFGEPKELESGARLARRGHLDRPEVEPGSMTLRDHEAGWVAQLGVKALDAGQWENVFDELASDPRIAASVITGELPIELHGRTVAVGGSLLPDRRELGADCSCHDWHEPCRHVGALVALVADMVAADPWLLTMLRGRTRDEIVRSIRLRRASRLGIEPEEADTTRGLDLGVGATAAFRREPGPLPSPLPGLRRPGEPVAVRPPPVDAGIEMADLERLVADAADRAFSLLAGQVDADALLIDKHEDLARIELRNRPRDP